MKYSVIILLFYSFLFANDIRVIKKKNNFIKIILPNIKIVYNKLDKQYLQIKNLIKSNPKDKKIAQLKKSYNAKSNQDLLIALKPHPISIVIAQASIESAWGKSRIFKVSNNLFGIWSFSKNEPRIKARKTRDGKSVYLKKYKNIKSSIYDYYKLISVHYKKFKQKNYKTNNPLVLARYLKTYSEKRDRYTRILIGIIKYNHLEKYDKKSNINM